ncbi:uncharacterized protein FOMMEDRAFT_139193 [Fomitiporia mediterranea MF3/22]|uniref:uncharacterized protein n=1 Tax=Fomitiporia mediterranea (strain MF3/22) TaxID=694068 RepID=UPI000440947B|nr:uncharacterized protein FOMMEDRAFT_139193 [Fomitiporia mediterranea MF3/22]EJD05869.1 hypothetical protein FOMMEDRAFT_139193 [Fomitiporia mediterranea MF3/22]
MHHRQRLDSPPPPSHFRRPWSPQELESYSRSTAQRLRRQPSDANASLEVLDLADYSGMLSRYPDTRHNIYAANDATYYPEYPATPPRTLSLANRGSLPAASTNPPSLVSGVTSTSHTHSPRLHTPPPLHRPFSLPPTQFSRSPPASNSGRSHNYPWLVEPQVSNEHDEEIDTSAFPDWSRNWYRNQKSTNAMADPYAPIPTFDPALLPSVRDSLDGYYPAQPYASSSGSHRNLLPWSPQDDGGTGARVTPEMKEERMRMLEREFGRTGAKQGEWYRGTKVIGSVNEKGNIITPGPKKRIIVRWAQGTFALGASIASLYSALILKPVGSPPPRGTVPAYLLYFLCVVSVILLLYMFVFRPCCCSGKRARKAQQEGPGGMMVLPVQQLPGAPGKKKKKKKGKKKGEDNDAGSVSVNLIVDPTMFGNFGRRDEEKEDNDETGEASEGPGGRRRGLFEGLAMEQQWIEARKNLKRLLFFDIALTFIWGAELIVILLGKRCPVGQFEGWCDGYNVATALAAFLAVSFGFSGFFDIKDLHLSKASPRTRT